MELSRNNANDIPPLGSPALPPGTHENQARSFCAGFAYYKTGHLVLIFPILQCPMSYSLVSKQNDITQGLKILEIITGED
jgi:hypothetical protein